MRISSGLRDPGSYIDVNHPEGYLSDSYFRGSGTSESAALVSGAAALVLQKYPNATPDQVKQLLMASATTINAKSQAQGDGELNLTAALGGAAAGRARGAAHRHGDGLARAGTRRRSPDGARRHRAERRTGHLRHAVQLQRDGGPRGHGVELVWRHLERFHLERFELVRRQLAREHLVGVELVRFELVGVELEREQLERIELEREQLVGLVLERLELVRRRLARRDLGLT